MVGTSSDALGNEGDIIPSGVIDVKLSGGEVSPDTTGLGTIVSKDVLALNDTVGDSFPDGTDVDGSTIPESVSVNLLGFGGKLPDASSELCTSVLVGSSMSSISDVELG